MAYPAGVTVRAINFSGITDAEDGTEPADSIRLIVACNEVLIHIDTGRILLPTPQIFSAGFSLPVTDQEGEWKDSYGNVLTSPTHTYHIDMEYKNEFDDWVKVKSWPELVLPDGAALDIDTYFDGLLTPYTSG